MQPWWCSLLREWSFGFKEKYESLLFNNVWYRRLLFMESRTKPTDMLGNKTNSKHEIASSFNSFFAYISKHFSNKIHCDTPNTISTYMKQKMISSFEFQCIDGTAVHKIISDLSVKNSCGVYGIFSKLLKTTSPVIAAPLAHIINQSLYTGIFSDRLKLLKSFLYIKRMTHIWSTIIGQYISYQFYLKCLTSCI